MSIRLAVRRVYHAVTTEEMRKAMRDDDSRLARVVRPLQQAWHRGLTDEVLYDHDYFLEQPMRGVAAEIAASLYERFKPRTVVDVGCGGGDLVQAFAALGVDARGLDGSAAAVRLARGRGLAVEQVDLEQPVEALPHLNADLVCSTEVAEHLPAAFADTYVTYLTRIAPTVVLTAAPPGQGGTDHVNEQPPTYWITRFAARGHRHDGKLTEQVRHAWNRIEGAGLYAKNLLVFQQVRERPPKSPSSATATANGG